MPRKTNHNDTDMTATILAVTTLTAAFALGRGIDTNAAVLAYRVGQLMAVDGAPSVKDACAQALTEGYRSGTTGAYYTNAKAILAFRALFDGTEDDFITVLKAVGYRACYNARDAFDKDRAIATRRAIGTEGLESVIRTAQSEDTQRRTGGKKANAGQGKKDAPDDVPTIPDGDVTLTIPRAMYDRLHAIATAAGLTPVEILVILIDTADEPDEGDESPDDDVER